MSLRDQIEDAKRHIKKLKRVSPYIFHQWQRLEQAKAQLKAARTEYEAAKKAWREL